MTNYPWQDEHGDEQSAMGKQESADAIISLQSTMTDGG
jgi:hypothetical protein